MYVFQRRFSTSSNGWLFGGILLIGLVPMGTIGWVKWRERVRLETDRAVYLALATIETVELEFRANDRDRNGIQDFWTGDLAGLFSTKVDGQPIAILPRFLAEADAAPLEPLVPKPIPYHGYYFKALDADERKDPPEPYRQDTDNKSGKVHNLRKNGFCAFPAWPETGKRVWIIDEEGNAFQSIEGMINPPKNWPGENELKKGWMHRTLQ